MTVLTLQVAQGQDGRRGYQNHNPVGKWHSGSLTGNERDPGSLVISLQQPLIDQVDLWSSAGQVCTD